MFLHYYIFTEHCDQFQPSERNDYVLNLGTRIFMDSSISPQATFAAKAKQNYQTDIKQVDFKNASSCANYINDWVATVTNGKIPSLVTEGDKNICFLYSPQPNYAFR